MQKLPRGVRNNNPGNIDFNKANNWVGQTGIETGVPTPRFATFDKPENGIRAIAKLLQTYHRKGFKTIAAMINRWAPDSENNTIAYIRSVSQKLGIMPTTVLEINVVTLTALVTAIIRHEQGYDPYTPAVINIGVRSAF